MSVELYVAKIASEVLAERERLEFEYRTSPDENLYFMMVDLVQSSNYRLRFGPERGFIRGETFFSLVNSATRRYIDVRKFKEMGDAVLMCCTWLRPLLESAILIDRAARQISFPNEDASAAFGVRMGIDFGIAKRLSGRDEDFLGVVIDRLARIMSVRSERSNFLLGERAFSINEAEIQQYAPIASHSGPHSLVLPPEKAVSEPIIYREVFIKRGSDVPFTDYFAPWQRNAAEPRSS